MTEASIAVTVIGGYLGAGKTTLVNHILRTADDRVAVLVNDFGDINIDEDLIASQDGDTISLANGCICCSLVDGFAAALETVRAFDPRPKRLVIESSGVADPATVAAYGHAPGLTLDATVVVVDAEMIRLKANDKYVGDTVVQQLGSGDIVVMNKIDLVSPEDAELTATWLRERAPGAVIIEAANAIIDPALLFGIADSSAYNDAIKGKAAASDKALDDQHADSIFESWSWVAETALDRNAVERMMEAMPDEIVRTKGLLVLNDDDALTALQGVGRRWSLRRVERRTEAPVSKIVLIGFHDAIAEGWIEEQLS